MKIAALFIAVPFLFSCGGSSSTVEPPGPFEISDTAPSDGEDGVPVDSNVTITWNQPVDCSTVTPSTVTATSTQWELKSCSGSHAIFYPSGQQYASSYEVAVAGNVRSASGANLFIPVSFSYTTTSSPTPWAGTLLEGGVASDSATDGVSDAAGNVYIIGSTSSDLFAPNQGNQDVFVASYDAGGVRRWAIQFGDTDNDRGLGIAIGNDALYIVGNTYEGGFGMPLPDDSLARLNAFVAKLGAEDGDIIWLRRFGTIQDDSARDVTVDASGSIYIAGSTFGDMTGIDTAGNEDAFLARFSDAVAGDGLPGSREWVAQFGGDATAEDAAAVAVTDDFLYIAGKSGVVDTQGDAYASRHSLSDGRRLSQWRLGDDGVDYANALAVDARDNLYIAGRTETDIDDDGTNVQGDSDAFLARIDPAQVEAIQWIEVLASPAEDEAFGLAADAFGNIYVTGKANADLVDENNNHQGVGDVFIGRLTTDGDRNWLDFLGTSGDETGFEVFPGPGGAVFMTGATHGDLDGVVNAGGSDAFLVRYTSAGVLE